MIQQWWSKSSDDPDLMMIQWCSKSSVDPDLMMIHRCSRSGDDPDLMMIQWCFISSNYPYLKMNWRWRWIDDDPNDTEKNTCSDKLCQENTFLVKRECWCICNFGMYSLIYLILYPNVPIKRVINIINSCKFIEVNLPLLIGGQSPHSWGALGLLDSPSEVGLGK